MLPLYYVRVNHTLSALFELGFSVLDSLISHYYPLSSYSLIVCLFVLFGRRVHMIHIPHDSENKHFKLG